MNAYRIGLHCNPGRFPGQRPRGRRGSEAGRAHLQLCPRLTCVPPCACTCCNVSCVRADRRPGGSDPGQTVEWYRTLGTQQQTATQPSDLLILYANQQTADQVVGLAFDIARANAELLSSEASSADPPRIATLVRAGAEGAAEETARAAQAIQDGDGCRPAADRGLRR